MFLRSTVLLLVALAAPAALAQNQTFDLIFNGKSIGKDTYTIAKSKTGFKLSSHFALVTRGLAVNVRDTFNFTPDYTYIDGTEENQDYNRTLTWLPSKDRKSMNMNSLAQGAMSSKIELLAGTLPFINIPAFDAGAVQAAILFIASHASDTGYTAWVPGSPASAPATASPAMTTPPSTRSSSSPQIPIPTTSPGSPAPT